MPNSKKIIIIITVTFTILAGIWVYLRFVQKKIDLSKYPVKGIDISHHQKKIDWAAMKKNKEITFIIIKATEGMDWQDTLFERNWSNSHAKGYITGAYHFFKHSSTGLDQAANYIKTVPVVDNSLPPVVDLEDMKAKPETCKKELRDFLTTVEAHYKKRPIIYTNYGQYNYYILNDFKEYPIWMYDDRQEPVLMDKRRWAFWQYSHNGQRAGINGDVDLNCFRGSQQELIAMTKKTGN